MAILRRVLRVLLWPVADGNWQMKIKKRRLLMRLALLDVLEMPPEGSLMLEGDMLSPHQLYEDGSVRVGNVYLRPRQYKEITRLDSNVLDDPPEVPWLEWYGNMFIMERVDHEQRKHHIILTFENGSWRQWQFLTGNTTFLHSL